jgi:transcriptional regulator with XRE-family HTH domain
MRRRRRKPQRVPLFPLRQLLREKGWTQSALARSARLSQQRVSDIVNGRHAPAWRTILKICTTLGVDLGELVPRNGG